MEYKLVHETTITNFLNIVKDQTIFKSSVLNTLGIDQAQCGRRVKLASDPTVPLSDPQFYDHYDQVDGVYFRIIPTTFPYANPEFEDCALVFDMGLLNHNKFIINRVENYGFCLGPEGVFAESPFSGEFGLSVMDLAKVDLILQDYVHPDGFREPFDPSNSEVVVMDNVNLNNLNMVVMDKEKLYRDVMDVCSHNNITING